jgi:translocation and assembly module TamB
MSEEGASQSDPSARGRNWSGTFARIIAWIFGILIVTMVVLYYGLNTDIGKRFVVQQIQNYKFENGMRIGIGRIQGSLYGEMTVKDLTFTDKKGVFVRVPNAVIDWRPFKYFSNHVDVRSLTAQSLVWYRLPDLKPGDPNAPYLPDLDIDIGKLRIDRIEIGAAVAGQPYTGSFSGTAKIADRRAQIVARGGTLKGQGIAGGDVFDLRLDAVPDDNKFDVAMTVNAPKGGLITGLLNVQKPLSLALNGNGDWNKWRGAFIAKNDTDTLTNLALTADKGRFAAKGDARIGAMLNGATAKLFEPVTQIDTVALLSNRKIDLDASITSANLSGTAKGLIDLADNRFGDLTLDFRIMRPSQIATNLGGQGITARALLNGAFAEPVIAYTINAARISFNEITLEGVIARGEAKVDPDRILIPVNASARRVSGINATAGGLLNNVRLNGDLAMAKGRILSDNLKIRSDRIDATAIVVADLNTGLYTGALKGRVNGYRIDSVGMFNIETDVDLETKGQSGFVLRGTVTARSTKLFNDGVRNFLGGNTIIRTGISYGSDGVARISGMTAVSPQFRLRGGQGSYTANGQIRFTGNGFSSQYGAVAVAVSGTVNVPVAVVTAQSPGFGIGLSRVRATIRGNVRGYGINVAGATDYGPLTADVDILSGKGPLTIDIARANFAGVALTGRIQKTTAGPFAGTLTGVGSGFDGTILLSALGNKQRAVVNATANNAQLSGARSLAIGQAIIAADIILHDQPQIVADVQLADARMDKVFIGAARATIDYRGGRGTAKLLAEGSNQAPFRVAANALLEPGLWRVAARGRANSIDFYTQTPARIIPRAGTYELLPTTIALSRGSMQIAGSYGRGIKLQSRLNTVDLALLNPIYPGLGLGGSATGSLDFAQSSPQAFPSADARLSISGFTRTTLASVSKPVDMSIVGRLLPEGGNMRAIVRRRGVVVGQAQVNLNPLPPGSGTWTTRLASAPLSGGIRYNGPADTLFSLAALPDQSLSGPIGVAADFSGRVQKPQLTGVVRANNLVYENNVYGTKLTRMKVRGTFTNDQLNVTELTAIAGKGTVSGKGFVSLSSDRGFPVQLNLDLDGARIANSDYIASEATGNISVVNNPGAPATITGTLRLPETRYKIVRQTSAKVATLTGVRRKPALGRQKITGDVNPVQALPSNWNLDIKLIARDKVFVSGMGLESEWSANLRVAGTSSAPKITGQIDVVRGTLGFAGRSFTLDSGRISFAGSELTNPNIRLSASSVVDGVTTRITVRGTGNNPDIAFSSVPNLPQEEIMARILFGNSVGELSAVQTLQLAGSLNSLRGSGKGLNPLGVLQSAAGIDRLRILGPDENSGRGTAVAVGQYITNDVYVEIVTDARGYTATQLEISLTRALSVLGEVGSFGGSNINVRYRKDY